MFVVIWFIASFIISAVVVDHFGWFETRLWIGSAFGWGEIIILTLILWLSGIGLRYYGDENKCENF